MRGLGTMVFSDKIKYANSDPAFLIQVGPMVQKTYRKGAMMRSEYFPTFQCTKRLKVNFLIHLQKLQNNTFKLFVHMY